MRHGEEFYPPAYPAKIKYYIWSYDEPDLVQKPRAWK